MLARGTRSRLARLEKIYRLGRGLAPIPALAAGNDVGRTVGRGHFARAHFLPATADRIQGSPFHARKISHHEGECRDSYS